jgi:GNAT superfamily N-acetyltransferase
MPTLTTYEQQNFPSVYKWQAIAFMRCEWASIFQGDILYMSETYSPEFDPIHFVMAEGESLLSYAAILKRNLLHMNREYAVYGFGNMFTFPPYRNQGYGQKVLRAATEFIQRSTVDVAILFCDKSLEKYYNAKGWLATPSPTYISCPEEYLLYEPLRMMIFISDKGKAAQTDFENSPLCIDYPW